MLPDINFLSRMSARVNRYVRVKFRVMLILKAKRVTESRYIELYSNTLKDSRVI